MSNESNRNEGAAREIGGKIKKGVGELIGDDKMAAEGKVKELKGEDRQKKNT